MGFDNPQPPSDTTPTSSIVPCDKEPIIKIVLRSKQGLVSKPGSLPSTELKPDYLPEFLHTTDCQITSADKFKALETRFYIDLATEEGTSWYAKRKITAVVTQKSQPSQPAPGKQVKWEKIGPGSDNLKFEDSIVATDSSGWAEVTIKHVVEQVAKDKRKVTLKATLVDTGECTQADIYITRNDDVSSLDAVMANVDREGEADAILVFQPTEEGKVTSAAVGMAADNKFLGLNHLLNQVVSRHKGIVHFDFIDEDGFYRENTRRAVEHFIKKFKSIKPPHWPYDLSNVGVYKSLKDYVNLEYAPFKTAYDDGLIVDRHLLIGKKENDGPNNIDGLHELKSGVVDKLVAKMNAVALDYIESPKFWLHRPEDQPYVAGEDVIAVVVTTETPLLSRPLASHCTGEAKPRSHPSDVWPVSSTGRWARRTGTKFALAFLVFLAQFI